MITKLNKARFALVKQPWDNEKFQPGKRLETKDRLLQTVGPNSAFKDTPLDFGAGYPSIKVDLQLFLVLNDSLYPNKDPPWCKVLSLEKLISWASEMVQRVKVFTNEADGLH